jgi:hypothetical protein
MKASLWFLISILSVGAATAAGAQSQPSLADLARKESERRKTTTKPQKVYTNDDVKQAGAAPITTAAARTQTKDEQASDKPAADQKAGEPAAAQEPAKDEAFWRERMTQAREQLNRSRLFAEALQSRINALTTDFVNRADPVQREQIARQRQEAIAELDRVNHEIESQTKALADLEEEARRGGVPPGWLR